MIERRATVLVADELLVSLNGKFNLLGMYAADILIPANPTTAAQLVFLFLIETDVEDPFRSLTLEVSLPGSTPNRLEVGPLPTVSVLPGRRQWNIRWPFLIPLPVLRPGHIEAKVVHEKGELIASAPWISIATATPPPAAPSA
jgi:hypothetical protein